MLDLVPNVSLQFFELVLAVLLVLSFQVFTDRNAELPITCWSTRDVKELAVMVRELSNEVSSPWYTEENSVR